MSAHTRNFSHPELRIMQGGATEGCVSASNARAAMDVEAQATVATAVA